MNTKSIHAYSNAERALRYDREMDLLHPNRHRMLEVALEVIPYLESEPLRILDLGTGTGLAARRFLDRYPFATVTAVDGSAEMIALAQQRLCDAKNRTELRRSSFQDLPQVLPPGQMFDLVFSSLALHHLDADTKGRVIAAVVSRIRKGGWFLNADLVICPRPEMAERILHVRAVGIARRNAGRDPRFATAERVRAFIDTLRREESDQPLLIDDDLALLREAGIGNAIVFWQEYEEVLYGGTRG